MFEDETSPSREEVAVSHSTPHTALSHSTQSPRAVSRSVSQATGNTSVGSSLSGESHDIFAQIHSLNTAQSEQELSAQPEQRDSGTLQSDLTNVSEVALLSQEPEASQNRPAFF